VSWKEDQRRRLCTLGIIGEHDGITQQGHDAYSNLFAKPLADVHLEDLTTFFNWYILDFVDQDSVGVAMS
jgi:hypothetical protein